MMVDTGTDTDTAVAGDAPAGLTPLPEKVAAYRRDTWFQESYEQTSRLVGDAAAFAHRHGLLLLKPDAVVARAVEPTLDWLVDNGFTVVAARRIHVDRNLVRALWYFQWNSASAERRHLADLLLRVSDSMVLVVADTGTELPASVRLTELKGPTDPGKRTEGRGDFRRLPGVQQSVCQCLQRRRFRRAERKGVIHRADSRRMRPGKSPDCIVYGWPPVNGSPASVR